MICKSALAIALSLSPCAALCQTEGGTLPAETPVALRIDEHLPMRDGQPVRGHLMYPIYANDKLLLPKDTNAMGTIFGGVILSHVDLASAVEARKVAPRRYVTRAMREVEFHEPVFLGDIVSFYARVMKVGRTSITVDVEVFANRGRTDVGDFARSHTGALTPAWRTARAALRAAGAVLVDDERELVDALVALEKGRLPADPGPGVGKNGEAPVEADLAVERAGARGSYQSHHARSGDASDIGHPCCPPLEQSGHEIRSVRHGTANVASRSPDGVLL